MTDSDDFPSVFALWRGAILGGIINAVMTTEDTSFAPFRQWIRNHYVVNGGNGQEGVISFSGGHWYSEGPLVGVFFSPRSSRNPLLEHQEWKADQAFVGATTYQRDLADQAAMTFLELEDGGERVQRVTTAFWDKGGRLAASDTWELTQEHGAELILDEIMAPSDLAMNRWRLAYEMNDDQIDFSTTLFSRKLDRPPARLILSSTEAKWLRTQSKDSQAFDLCCQMLKEMDIIVLP